MNRREKLYTAIATLEAIERELRDNAKDPESSVPVNTSDVLLRARAILKTFGGLAISDMEKRESAEA